MIWAPERNLGQRCRLQVTVTVRHGIVSEIPEKGCYQFHFNKTEQVRSALCQVAVSLVGKLAGNEWGIGTYKQMGKYEGKR